MKYRCPYCKTIMAAIPQDGCCTTCGRVMRRPSPTTPEERAERRRRRERMAYDAEKRIADLRQAPDGRFFSSPKIVFGFMFVLTIVGAMVVYKANPPKRIQPELPHQVALRQLDTLATALGRYHLHVGDYPPDSHGLRALINNPEIEGWDGPYVSVVVPDPWKTSYRYAYVSNGIPELFSCGPDTTPGTPDDLRPDPAAFNPGTDWTNGWVSAIYRRPVFIVKEPR